MMVISYRVIITNFKELGQKDDESEQLQEKKSDIIVQKSRVHINNNVSR